MSNERSSSKSGLFLIELIISIVFFAVASAICTQLFIQAHLISRRSNDLNIASAIAQNCAEELKNFDGPAWETLLGGGETSFSYYDNNGLPLTGMGEASYLLNLSYDGGSAPLYSAQIAVYRVEAATKPLASDESPGQPLFALQLCDYTGMNS